MTRAPARLDRESFVLEVDERFDQPELDRSRWLPYYLPHWSSREATRARYRLTDPGLVLRIDDDQPPWSPELDGATRVSSLQTGSFSGPVGSSVGQHHFRPGLRVRHEEPELRLLTLHHGLVEVRAAACPHPDALVALWMIGLEDRPEHSAEICVMEIFGRDVGPSSARVGVGVHPFGDPSVEDDFAAVEVPVDAREPHTYAARWTPDDVAFYVDDRLVRVVDQSPDYPMQLMLNIYDLSGRPPGPREGPPLEFPVEHVRVHRPAGVDRA